VAYVITEECVACGTCAEECPAEAIEEGEPYVINDENVPNVEAALRYALWRRSSKNEAEGGREVLLELFPSFRSMPL